MIFIAISKQDGTLQWSKHTSKKSGDYKKRITRRGKHQRALPVPRNLVFPERWEAIQEYETCLVSSNLL